ncbi:hypothetical protein C4564_03850 [Candidatus Microgenomates bacterium]|nr:MAG: hypothetical protein C4564_03850 [Candidatus Microgenomates bacterium]
MKIGKYIDVLKLSIRNKLEYRFNTFMGFVSRLIFFVTLYALWSKVYETTGDVKGLSFEEMISYTLLAIVVSSLVDTNIGKVAYKQIKDGEVSVFLIRPLNFITYHLFSGLGVFIFESVMALFVLIVMLNFLPGVRYLVELPRLISFALALVAANIIYTQLYLVVGILAFWIKEGKFLLQIVKKLVKFLAGGYIPIALFPIGLQKMLNYLPFTATIYFPTKILVDSSLTNSDLFNTILTQTVWIFVLLLINNILWRQGIKKYESVGI